MGHFIHLQEEMDEKIVVKTAAGEIAVELHHGRVGVGLEPLEIGDCGAVPIAPLRLAAIELKDVVIGERVGGEVELEDQAEELDVFC